MLDRTTLALPLAVLLASCSRAPTKPTPEPVPSALERAPIASASAALAPGPIPSTVAPEAVEMHVVLEDTSYTSTGADYPRTWAHALTLSVLGDAAYFGLGWSLLRPGADGLELMKRDWMAGLMRGPIGPIRINSQLGGRFPDALWVRAQLIGSPDGRIFPEILIEAERRDGAWIWQGGNAPKILRVVPWTRGRTLALTADGLEQLHGPRDGALPALAKLKAEDIDALPSGELFVLGRDADKQATLVVLRFAPDATAPVVDELPPLPPFAPESLEWAAVRAVGPKTAFVAAVSKGKGYLARFDGERWTPLALPEGVAPSALSIAKDGATWLLQGAEAAWRVSASGVWTKAPLPKLKAARPSSPPSPVGLWAASADDVWVGVRVAGPSNKQGDGVLNAILRSKKTARPRVLHDEHPDDFSRSELMEETRPQPITPDCKTPFVQLYGAKTEFHYNDYPFPATAAALEGEKRFARVELFTYFVGGLETEYLGASTASREEADAFAEMIRSKVKGSKPQVLCYRPLRPSRRLRFKTD